MYEALVQGKFDKFRDYSEIRREVTVLNSRFDFGLFSEGKEYYIEVKGVTLVENRQGFFPDAPTQRGTRHLEELTKIRQNGKEAGVAFIVQREDADVVRPNDRTDKNFANALRIAAEAGVDLMAYVCKVDAEQRRMDIVRRNTGNNKIGVRIFASLPMAFFQCCSLLFPFCHPLVLSRVFLQGVFWFNRRFFFKFKL